MERFLTVEIIELRPLKLFEVIIKMKNKNIISSVVGAGFFAVGYLGLSLALPPALLLGATSFVASELIINSSKSNFCIKACII